jgi:hypothetical protein
MLERTEKGCFVKGMSGNPGGRPKGVESIRDLARQYTEDAVQTLVTIAKDPKSSESARVQAAIALLDRAWGKPPQFTENVNVNGGLKEFLESIARQEIDPFE